LLLLLLPPLPALCLWSSLQSVAAAQTLRRHAACAGCSQLCASFLLLALCKSMLSLLLTLLLLLLLPFTACDCDQV
jgi:hypothetical protein